LELVCIWLLDYNNEIVTATSTQSLGLNNDINNTPIPLPPIVTNGTPTIKQGILEQQQQHTAVLQITTAEDREGNKTALIVGGITVGLLSILPHKIIS